MATAAGPSTFQILQRWLVASHLMAPWLELMRTKTRMLLGAADHEAAVWLEEYGII